MPASADRQPPLRLIPCAGGGAVHGGAPSTTGDAPPDPMFLEKSLAALGFYTASRPVYGTRIPSTLRSPTGWTDRASRRRSRSCRFQNSGCPPSRTRTSGSAAGGCSTCATAPCARSRTRFVFSTADLLRMLGLCTDSGKNYRDVEQWLDVMVATTIISTRACTSPASDADAIDFTSSTAPCPRGEPSRTAHCRTELRLVLRWQLENFQHDHVLFLDFAHTACSLAPSPRACPAPPSRAPRRSRAGLVRQDLPRHLPGAGYAPLLRTLQGSGEARPLAGRAATGPLHR